MAEPAARPDDARRYADMIALAIDPGVPLLNPDHIEHAMTREPAPPPKPQPADKR